MNLFINDNMFKCKVCVTPNSIMDGMKNKTFNMNFNGMFFIMPNKSEQTFYMYECLTPLDIVMIDGDTITKIHHDCLPCEVESSCEEYSGYGNYILELQGGTCHDSNIKEGDLISTTLY